MTPRWRRCRACARALAVAALGLAGAGACAPTPASPARPPAATGAPVPRVAERTGVPPLLALERAGDPDAAVAVALAHGEGLRASRGLGAALARRLADAGVTAEAAPSALGVTLTVRAATASDADRALRALASAVATPLTPTEAATTAALAAARAPAPTADGGVDVCAGEGAPAEGAGGAGAPTAGADADATRVERWRATVHRASAAAFAVVGGAPWVAAARAAHATLGVWPAAPATSAPWPAPALTVGAPAPGTGGLAVAVRVADGGRALGAGERLALAGADLAARLRTLDPPWAVERVTPTLHPRGACLRVDLAPTLGATAAASLGAAAAVAEEELAAALALPAPAPPVAWAARLTDPADAAPSAAWAALHAPADDVEPTPGAGAAGGHASLPAGAHAAAWLHVTPAAGSAPVTAARFTAAHAAAHARPRPPVTVHAEPGQGRLWLLLASPCGTRAEDRAGAGHTLAALTALGALPGEVTLEPWATPDGAGLVAHAPLRPGEPPTALARRVAQAAARALGGARLDAAERAAALLGAARRAGELSPARTSALELLSGGHPGGLDATGTATGLLAATPDDLAAARRALAEGPLRAAVLAPHAAGAPLERAVSAELARWLHLGAAPTPCPTPPPRAVAAGRVEVGRQPRRRDDAGPLTPPSAVVAAALPSASAEAQALVFLLERRGGWLDEALRGVPGARARARLVGGAAAAAVLVEITAAESTQRAVDEIRAALDALSGRGVTAAELAAATAEAARSAAARARDPRTRLLHAWGLPAPEAPRADRLAALLPALRGSALLVVTDPGG